MYFDITGPRLFGFLKYGIQESVRPEKNESLKRVEGFILIITDGFVKSRRKPFYVIPVKLVLDLIGERESSVFNWLRMVWIPACAGMTTFYESIITEFLT